MVDDEDRKDKSETNRALFMVIEERTAAVEVKSDLICV